MLLFWSWYDNIIKWNITEIRISCTNFYGINVTESNVCVTISGTSSASSCSISIDETKCNICQICTVPPPPPQADNNDDIIGGGLFNNLATSFGVQEQEQGILIDCDNIAPNESTNGTCISEDELVATDDGYDHYMLTTGYCTKYASGGGGTAASVDLRMTTNMMMMFALYSGFVMAL